ncbi:hypothetical protein [Terrabacter sp. BE26]|uniref:hypothetical protein n=1 Tax=Terrabacter sp. BE26 TaxID=2898152 RepID=UPI0035BE46DE
MSPVTRSVVASVSTGLLLLLGVAACSAQGADLHCSTFQVLPTQSTTGSMTPVPEAPAQTSGTAAAAAVLPVPSKRSREISRVVVNLSAVPGKTSALTRVPQAGRLHDLRAACVMRADIRDRVATLTLTDSSPGATPTVSLRVPCDGEQHILNIGPLPSKLALPALTGEATSGLRGYAILLEH